MLAMTNTNTIREMFFQEGRNISEIARYSGFSRKTIRKYIYQDDWNEDSSSLKEKSSILDPFKDIIDEWIQNDMKVRAKQRHTAWRVYQRLLVEYGSEGFDASYRTVANYVKIAKKRIYRDSSGHLPLQHKPGEAQVDFGKAEFIESGTRYYGSYLNISFPYSNSGYLQLFRGETFECLGEGLKAIYEHVQGVPGRQWFDNASSMVKKVLKEGERDLTDAFLRFKAHYQFDAEFCNPASGNEKGSVESKVGYHRRNFLVPVPEFDNLQDFNRKLLELADQDQNRLHYEKKVPIAMLFEEDRKALSPLPAVSFDVCTYESARVDNYGKITLNKGKHKYSTIPRLAGSRITVCLRADDITVLDENMKEIVRHRRLYGKSFQESMDWIPYLEQLSRHPNALKYTGIYSLLPDPVKTWMDGLKRSDCGKALRVLSRMTTEADFQTATHAFRQALDRGATDLDSVEALFNRYNSFFPEMEKIPLNTDIPRLEPISTDATRYDHMLKKVGRE